MSHVEPITGYKIHQSIKLTLCSPKYDMMSKGLVCIKPQTFDNRKDRMLYRNITSKLDREEVIFYFLANCLVGNTYPLLNFNEEGMQNLKEFMRRKASLSYIFESELTDCSLEVSSAKELYSSVNDNPPLIVSYYLGGMLSAESLCLLQLCCIDVLSIDYDDYIWRQKKDFIRKYLLFFDAGFITFDEEKISKIYKKIFDN